MHRFLSLLLVVATPLSAQDRAETIETPQGRCVVWASPMGGSSSRDRSYRRCALDRPPVLRPDAEMPPSPRASAHAGRAFRIIVNADGLVDQELTRAASATGDDESHEQILATIKRWRFEPGARAGVAVRSAFDIEVRTDSRPSDTLPARLEWRYVSGWERDTLAGRWVAEPRPEPFTSGQVDSVYLAMLRRLKATDVVRPIADRAYCVAADPAAVDRQRLARIVRVARTTIPGLTAGTCVDTPHRVRLLLPRVHRTESGRAVLYVSGSQLPRWPSGFDGRAWLRWKGRCIGVVRERDTVPITCDIGPDAPWEERYEWYVPAPLRPPGRAPRTDGEPVRLTVLAMMAGAYGLDTLSTIVRDVPRLQDVALLDSLEACRSWLVLSPRDTNTFVVHGDLTDWSLHITRAQIGVPAPVSQSRPPCGEFSARPDRFAAFLLGGVGDQPLGPVTLCFTLRCGRRYTLDAAKHTLAQQPHLRIPLAALRDASRVSGGVAQIRLTADPVPDGLMPIVVIVRPGGPETSAWRPRNLGGGVWEWDVTMSPTDWRQTEALVYLARR